MSYREIDTTNLQEIMNKCNISSLTAKIVVANGFTVEDCTSFFDSVDSYQFDEKIYEPIRQKLFEISKQHKKVFVFGDYDCDGVCATAVAVSLLRKLNIEVGYYIPSRLSEGYGLNLNRLQQAHQKGYQVVLTVDNGVSANSQLSWAKENGMDVIVTDHHIITEKVNCDYLLHPSLLAKDYQYMCGCAVIYSLAEYMGLADDSMRILAMLTTISDVMSLKGVNLKIVRDGLDILNNKGSIHIESLDRFSKPISETDISFKVVPKINAVGRMSTTEISQANQVVNYLLSNNPREMAAIKEQIIIYLNDYRKQVSSAQYKLVEDKLDDSSKVNIVYVDDLHIGILGLLANKLVSETNKISFVLTNNEDKIIGSARSVKGFDIMAIMEKYRENTLALGGHSGACGFSISPDKLDDFKKFIINETEDIQVDSENEYISVDFTELTTDNLKEVFSHRPYGQDRNLPLMKVRIDNSVISMMRTETQLKWKYPQIDFVSFDNKGINEYKDKPYLEVIGTIGENKFAGRLTYQMMVKEILG